MIRTVGVLLWAFFLSLFSAAAAAAAAATTTDNVKSSSSSTIAGAASNSCRFAPAYTCEDFSKTSTVDEYLSSVMKWEGKFAKAGVGYDAFTGYTYDGQFLDYNTGDLSGEPHLFSAPSKESIHVSLLALAVSGNTHALEFVGGLDAALQLIDLKLDGYEAWNATYPAYGCFTPWVSFSAVNQSLEPAWDWSDPYRVPGLDNGEWFWSLYALAGALDQQLEREQGHGEEQGQGAAEERARRVHSMVDCQKQNMKTMFYRGDGDVSAVICIIDPFLPPMNASNYKHCDGWLNDPYEEWDTPEEKELLWMKKRDLFEAVNYTIPAAVAASEGLGDGAHDVDITVQRGWWFSTHEQWKLLLMPYLSPDLDIVRRVFRNAEIARSWDAVLASLPGFFASVNDVTSGSQEIPGYISATGVQAVAFEEVLRRDVVTPYAGYSMLLFDLPTGLCWYNNILRGPRMQGPLGSTESCKIDGSDICPLVTWDSKITSVLAMLGGVGPLVGEAMKADLTSSGVAAHTAFVEVVLREHERVFGLDPLAGEDLNIRPPASSMPQGQEDWVLSC